MKVVTVTARFQIQDSVPPADVLAYIQGDFIDRDGILFISANAKVPQKRGPKPKTTDHQKQSILVLADQGWKKASIATALGISRSTVQNTIRDEGSRRGEGR